MAAIKKAAGVYVGAKAVDVVSLEESAGKIRVSGFARKEFAAEPAKPRPVGTAEISDAEITNSVQKAFNEAKAPAEKLYTSLSAKDVTVRFFKMPYLTAKERDQAVKFEARKYIPFKIDEVFSSHVVVEENRKASQISILFAAVKRELATRHIVLLGKAGIRPKVIETVPTALSRLFSCNEQLDKKDATAILYILDEENANIYLIKDGVPYLTRDITLTADKSRANQKIAAELQTSFDYFKRQFPDVDVKKIILTGEDIFADLRESLAGQFGVAVETGDLTKNITAAGEIPQGACVAMGLALGGFEKAAQINLIPVALVSKKSEKVLSPAVIKTGALACVALLALGLTLNFKNMGIQNEIKNLEKSQPAVDEDIKRKSLSELQEFNQNLMKKANFLKSQTSGRILVTEKLNQLPVLLPTEGWLTLLSLQDSMAAGWSEDAYSSKPLIRMTLKGIMYADSRPSELKLINDFAQKIRSDETFFRGFGDVEIKGSKVDRLGSKEITNFEILISSK